MTTLRVRVFHREYGISKPLDLSDIEPDMFGVYFNCPNVALGSLRGQIDLASTGLTDKNGVEIFEGVYGDN